MAYPDRFEALRHAIQREHDRSLERMRSEYDHRIREMLYEYERYGGGGRGYDPRRHPLRDSWMDEWGCPEKAPEPKTHWPMYPAPTKALGLVSVHFTGEDKPVTLYFYDESKPYEGAEVMGSEKKKGFVPVGGIFRFPK